MESSLAETIGRRLKPLLKIGAVALGSAAVFAAGSYFYTRSLFSGFIPELFQWLIALWVVAFFVVLIVTLYGRFAIIRTGEKSGFLQKVFFVGLGIIQLPTLTMPLLGLLGHGLDTLGLLAIGFFVLALASNVIVSFLAAFNKVRIWLPFANPFISTAVVVFILSVLGLASGDENWGTASNALGWFGGLLSYFITAFNSIFGTCIGCGPKGG